jgi:hypothetical protein
VGVFPVTVKLRVLEKEVDRREVIVILISHKSHRTDCTLPQRLMGRESRNRSSVANQAL